MGIYPHTDDETVKLRLARIEQPVVVCAHTHRPLDRRVDPWWQIYNCGSVGRSYNGDPSAYYLLLDLVQKGAAPCWRGRVRRLAYDQSIIPGAIKRSGMAAAAGPVSS